jgi:hypothetical protein
MELITVPRGLRQESKLATFTGAAGAGAIGTVALFTLTGRVLVYALAAVCTVDLVGATATISVGAPGAVSGLTAVTTATNIVTATPIWPNAAPVAGVTQQTSLLSRPAILVGSINADVLVAAITAGAIQFDVFWVPLTSNGLLVAA